MSRILFQITKTRSVAPANHSPAAASLLRASLHTNLDKKNSKIARDLKALQQQYSKLELPTQLDKVEDIAYFDFVCRLEALNGPIDKIAANHAMRQHFSNLMGDKRATEMCKNLDPKSRDTNMVAWMRWRKEAEQHWKYQL